MSLVDIDDTIRCKVVTCGTQRLYTIITFYPDTVVVISVLSLKRVVILFTWWYVKVS